MLILYRLGIPVPKSCSDLFDEYLSFFEYVKEIKMFDKFNRENICYLNANDRIIFCIFKERNVLYSDPIQYGYAKTVIKINKSYYWDFIDRILEKYDMGDTLIGNASLNDITDIVLRYKGFEFNTSYPDDLGKSNFKKSTIPKHKWKKTLNNGK